MATGLNIGVDLFLGMGIFKGSPSDGDTTSFYGSRIVPTNISAISGAVITTDSETGVQTITVSGSAIEGVIGDGSGTLVGDGSEITNISGSQIINPIPSVVELSGQHFTTSGALSLLDDQVDLLSGALYVLSGASGGGDVVSGALITGSNFVLSSAKTKYWSGTGADFIPYEAGANVSYTDRNLQANGNTNYIYAPVHLPHGATITSVAVYGNNSKVWDLYALGVSSGGNIYIASGAVGVADTSITTPIVNNNTHNYIFRITDLEDLDTITGAKIIYTIDEI